MLKGLTALFLSSFVYPSVALGDYIQLDFNFEVTGSAEDIYVCNAGLNTVNTASSVSYYDAATNAPLANCVGSGNCLSVDTQDQHLKNTLTATWGSYPAPTVANNTSSITSANNSTAGTSGVLFNISSDASWENIVTELSFDLASPGRDARFFIDVCFRGSAVEWYENHGSSLPLKWQVSSTITPQTLGSGRVSFSENLTAQATLACDVQGMGDQEFGRDENNTYNTLLRDITETSILVSGFTADIESISSLANLTSNSATNPFTLEDIASTGPATARAPRFCKVRYYFAENGNRRIQRAEGSLVTLTTRFATASN